MRSLVLFLLLASVVLATACARDDAQPSARRDGPVDEQLPQPAGGKGSVTGMPGRPGPGPVGPPTPPPAEVALDENGNPLTETPAEGLAHVSGRPEPTPEDAAAVIGDYYAAINRGEFARAYGLWADSGNASGQSPQQFAAGFAQTTGIVVEVMPPQRMEAAAGSRFIEIPVTITATQRDGTQRRFAGAYVLRRAVVDGATPEQQLWRIASADLREVQP